ncbi:signal transduction protein [Candidatus Bathyarchaeota archaeon]|nr:MAG: signal transduction protein [Candidatus Bathyarchaeota archaeon]
MSVQVKDIMIKDVITIDHSKSVSDVAKIMDEKKVGCVVVLKDGSPTGIVTERDLIRRVLAKNRNPAETKVSEVMSTPLISVRPELSVLVAAQEMSERKIRRLAVVEDGKLVGIITSFDLAKHLGEVTNLMVAAILRGMKLGSLMG